MFRTDVPVDEDGVIYFNHRSSNIDSEENMNTQTQGKQTDESQRQSNSSLPLRMTENQEMCSPTQLHARYRDQENISLNNDSPVTITDLTSILRNMTNVLTDMNSQLTSIKSKQQNTIPRCTPQSLHTQPKVCSMTSDYNRHSYDAYVNTQQVAIQDLGGEALDEHFIEIDRGHRFQEENERSHGHYTSLRDDPCHRTPEQNQLSHNLYRAGLNQRFEQASANSQGQGLRRFGNHEPLAEERPRRLNDFASLKLNAFTGEGDWQVWHSRFEVIARRFGLSDDEKLDQLLPRMEGKAAEFVFTQLPRRFLFDYDYLVQELNLRYRVIETPRSFAAKFSKRHQRLGETAEQYAADLKVLYDKAHGYRDRHIREEDLVRRFMDGLKDDEVRFEVEYHKEPKTIDEAAFHVVNFMQTRGRGERYRDSVRQIEEDCHYVGADDPFRRARTSSSDSHSEYQGQNNQHSGNQRQTEAPQELKILLEEMMKRLDRIEQHTYDDQRRRPNKRRQAVECFKCHEIGHFSRECPLKYQLSSQHPAVRYDEKEDHHVPDHLNHEGPALAAKGWSN